MLEWSQLLSIFQSITTIGKMSSLNEQLFAAIGSGNVNEVAGLLKRGASVFGSTKDVFGFGDFEKAGYESPSCLNSKY